jgi:hypothetical protein
VTSQVRQSSCCLTLRNYDSGDYWVCCFLCWHFGGSLDRAPWIGADVAREHLFSITAVALLGLGALELWTGAMPFCIIASERRNNRFFRLGQYCARIGHVLFFFSVAAALWFYYSIIRMP